LESFYLGDLRAVETALGIPGLSSYQEKAKFRNPDAVANPCEELERLTKGRYQKVRGSRLIGLHLDLDNNKSKSFRALVRGIQALSPPLSLGQ
jgi:hypothetical protein